MLELRPQIVPLVVRPTRRPPRGTARAPRTRLKRGKSSRSARQKLTDRNAIIGNHRISKQAIEIAWRTLRCSIGVADAQLAAGPSAPSGLSALIRRGLGGPNT